MMYDPRMNGPPSSSETRDPGASPSPEIDRTVGASGAPCVGMTPVRRAVSGRVEAADGAAAPEDPPGRTSTTAARSAARRGCTALRMVSLRDQVQLGETERRVSREHSVGGRRRRPHVIAQDLPEDGAVVGADEQVPSRVAEHDAVRPGRRVAVVDAAVDVAAGDEQARGGGVIGADAAVLL